MHFIRKTTRNISEKFKDLSEEVWDALGSNKPKDLKEIGRTAGKYAITSQLLMMMNFPDDSAMFQQAFNITGKGPTGALGFKDTPIGNLLDAVGDITRERNAQAVAMHGFADISQTSTIADLSSLVSRIDLSMKEKKRK